MKMMKFIAPFFAVVLLFSLSGSAFAAPPDDNPGKGPPEYDKIVFIHYGNEHHGAKPPGTPGGGGGNGGGGKKGDPELYSYSKVHWADADLPVEYYINTNGTPVSVDINDGIDAIKASFDAWENDPESYIDFNYAGPTSVAPGLDVASPDYTNVVGWADISVDYPNAIGITTIWSLRGRKTVVDVDTVLNTGSPFAWALGSVVGEPNGQWLTDTIAYDVDVQNIMTHEAGHWLVLNDLYNNDIYLEQTMYGISSDGELKKRSLESGDIAGVRKIY
ncbi:hypothetical protein ACFLTG_00775 [Chloroflexota bacterium]